MKTSGTNLRLRKLLSGLKNGTLIPRPEFQRRLVWANKHKIAFIQTVLEGLPFPEIYIAAGDVNLTSGEGNEMIVDGQQRISTLYQYFIGSDEIKYPSDVLPYDKLTPQEQEDFLEYEVVIRDLGKQTIENIKTIFQRINSTNYSLNAVEIHNSRFDGALKMFAEELSENSFFEDHSVFTNNDIKRMRDLGFSLLTSITLLSTYFNLETEFETFLEKYNDEFPDSEKLKTEVEFILNQIESLNFDEKSRVYKKNDLFSLIVELHRGQFKESKKYDNKKIEANLKNFYAKVDANDMSDDVQEYIKNVIQGTNSRSARITRGRIIAKVINE
ncbi:DUF262 domain-containing protein [Confluentibacter sediminis]|uniref:DUF262 domain-containing protein n=1 Tax=Confluentibacter sediminis TaxID=2219045 RepID=UPI000DADC267|nr:DUF262 domain-containing protein [Confluentibacter sediminis]